MEKCVFVPTLSKISRKWISRDSLQRRQRPILSNFTPWFDVEVLHAPVRKDSVACNDAESPLMFAPFPEGRAHVRCHESEADCTIGTCVRQLATLARTESIVQPRRLRDPGIFFINFRWYYFSWFHNLLWRHRYLLNVCSSLRCLEAFSKRRARCSQSHYGLLRIFAGVETSEQTDFVKREFCFKTTRKGMFRYFHFQPRSRCDQETNEKEKKWKRGASFQHGRKRRNFII